MTLKYFIIIFAVITIIIGGIMVYKNATKDLLSKSDKILFKLGVATPELSHIQVLEGRMRVSKGKRQSYISEHSYPYGFCTGSLIEGEPGGITCEIPTGIDMAWVSWQEKKVYKLNAQFPEEMLRQINELLETGIVDKDGDHISYRLLQTEIFPYGQVRFSLRAYISAFRSLNWTFQGEVTHEYDECIMKYASGFESVEEIFNSLHDLEYNDLKNLEVISESEKNRWAYYTVNNIYPTVDLWNSYYQFYDYSIEFDFLDSNDSLYFWSPWFSNGDHFSCKAGVNDNIAWDKTGVLYELNMRWRDSTYQYTLNSYYNETEMLNIFSKAFAEHPKEKGKLVFSFEKGENKYDISITLKIGDSSYPIEKTEIQVFRDPLSDLTGESDVFKNFEGDRQNNFIGL